ncbi:TPA: molybdopterin synthase catalytic subunit MoaE [Photobacterium damselae]|uniref:Molybdopterin synthase catalytic subunit n=3 Tax=Photobacterium damselae TaxID=38293 RepID=A0A1C3DPC3_PHODD|nr:molybdopterin synthase catalytic subunit MoaE [Photobacterium damselae]ARR49734.1 molybdopterin synthase catalytic subunit [Photobacterium damselae subsp. damselae]AWK81441.1 molybdopterin synthase catalytic subunit [Photobacterium damselae]ELI6448031.1 molybdopterin synthase catalytic subunit MoaE [Photobacterium damselae]ELV7517826.1 molybdopterin synthase catalytic subunit MoaE [Photobacterium damselae]KAB1177996.1 molybdopterin synthase catalytic subunit MoaE [Photobacterium damselae su
MISVQFEDFSVADEYEKLAQGTEAGAVVTFIGKVRDFNQGDSVTGLSLEHYPGMTEKALSEIVEQARARWPLLQVRVIHRVGDLDLGDQIVFVGVSSAHRGASFEACEFIMDYLKTRAPFWKKEQTPEESRWVDARESDTSAADRWHDK